MANDPDNSDQDLLDFIPDSIIKETHASGADIEAIITEMEPAFTGKPIHHVLIACITLSCMLMNPGIEVEDLQGLVKRTSQFIAMEMATLGTGMLGNSLTLN